MRAFKQEIDGGRGASHPLLGTALAVASGFCALVYQVAWARELRLVFGASTAAAAAVLAAFSLGLGTGSLVLSARVDRSKSPLRAYGLLECGVALSAAATPLLTDLVRRAYVVLRGAISLGDMGGEVLRLAMAGLVIFVPAFLMGGTLPALVRAFGRRGDTNRGGTAWLYGANTLGAVGGCMASTFCLLEAVGTRQTLLFASGVNMALGAFAVIAGRWRRESLANSEDSAAASEVAFTDALAPSHLRGDRALIYAACAVTGLAFFAMELVWYRMLGPLLGGSVFSFGTILAVALFGIGLGGFVYALAARSLRPSLRLFAMTSLLEALALAVPFALGDRLALLAIALRSLSAFGFSAQIAGWMIITALVVLPAALIAGFQFPLLVALLGRGTRSAGAHAGIAYVFNTAGAAIGSIGAGFVALPALGACNSWRALALFLVIVGAAFFVRSLPATSAARGARGFAPAAVVLFATLFCATRLGPTAVWRHSPIGAGRVSFTQVLDPDSLRNFENAQRRSIAWERDGRESSVAISAADGYAFIVNGKSDGHVRGDAATQVGVGLLGGLLHPNARQAAVIGLGTGSTAGWLGAMPSIEGVDVFELESNILEVARRSAPIAEDPLGNPKVHVTIGDARELLALSRTTYDVIISEPSNPYRAGIASLYTREYYELARSKMREDGMFLQWVQAYETSSETIRTVYATMHTVFPFVETWELLDGDLLLLGRSSQAPYDVTSLRARLATEPFRRGFENAWEIRDAEGLFAHFVARTSLADDIARLGTDAINTDDRSPLEFGLARNVGAGTMAPDEIVGVARMRRERLPEVSRGTVDVEESLYLSEVLPTAVRRGMPRGGAVLSPVWSARRDALSAWMRGDCAAAMSHWNQSSRVLLSRTEDLMVAECESQFDGGAPEPVAPATSPSLRTAEASLLTALRMARSEEWGDASAELVKSFALARRDPWVPTALLNRATQLAPRAAAHSTEAAQALLAALAEPFPMSLAEELRKDSVARISLLVADKAACVRAFAAFEPHVPWQSDMLGYRAECYRRAGSPLAESASEDLRQIRGRDAVRFSEGLLALDGDPTALRLASPPTDSR